MSFKTTLVLLALLLGLGAFYWFYGSEQPSTEDAERGAKLMIPGFQPGEFHRIVISRPRDPTATAIVLTRPAPKEKWRIVEPVQVEADQEEADMVLSTVRGLEKKRSMESVEEAKVGLDPPRLKLELGSGEKAKTILFGDEDHTGRNVYAKVLGRKDVHLVEGYAFSRLDRKAAAFRDKEIFTVDRWLVGRMILGGHPRPTAPTATAIAFKKDGERWMIDGPEADFADAVKVDDLLGAAHGTKAKDFAADAPSGAELAEYGLHPPRFSVTLDAGAAGGTQTLEVGAAVPGEKDSYYARRGDRAGAIVIDKHLVDQLTLDVDAWRSKNLFPPLRDQVRSIEIRRPASEKPLARLERKDSPGAAENRWRFVAPDPAPADESAVEDLLRALQDLQVLSTIARKIEDPENFGLGDKQSVVVTLETAKEKHAVRFGKGTLRTDAYYASREARPAALEVLFPKAPALRQPYSALRDKALLSRPPADIVRIDIQKAGAPARPYVRMENGWTTPEKTADAASLDRLAEELAGLRAERILLAPEDMGSIGLKTPWLKAIVSFRSDSESLAVIELGKILPEGDAFHARLRGAGATVVFALRKDIVDALDRDHFATSTSTSTSTNEGTRPEAVTQPAGPVELPPK